MPANKQINTLKEVEFPKKVEKIEFQETSSYVKLKTWINERCVERPEVDYRLMKSSRNAGGLDGVI